MRTIQGLRTAVPGYTSLLGGTCQVAIAGVVRKLSTRHCDASETYTATATSGSGFREMLESEGVSRHNGQEHEF